MQTVKEVLDTIQNLTNSKISEIWGMSEENVSRAKKAVFKY